MIYKYENQDQIPGQLLCFVCASICEIPFQCSFCDQLICFKCIQQSQCYNCKNEQYTPSKFLINHFIEMVKCKCQYCSKYIKYLKFRSHQVICQVIHNDLKSAFLFLENYSNDNKINQDYSKIQENISLNNQEAQIDCKDFVLKNKIKLICKQCNNIIQYVNAKQHLKCCLEINKTESLQCDSELNNDDFISIVIIHFNQYKYSLKSCIQNGKNYSNTMFQSFRLDAEFYMNELDKKQLKFQQQKLWKKQNFI